jgi:hypothetical protein
MNKIQAIRQTISNLENNVYEYNWTDADSCNCGVLARSIMGGVYPRKAGFSESPMKANHLTCFANNAICITTNLPLPRVFSELKNAGFSHEDIMELENLSNPVVIKKAGMSVYRSLNGYMVNSDRSDKHYLVAYLKTWAEILEEENQTIQPIPEPIKEKVIHHYVSVPTSITEQIKELELN